MATYKTGWIKKLISGVSTKVFAIAHAKSTYWNYSKGQTLFDVCMTTSHDMLTDESLDDILTPGFYYAKEPNACTGLPGFTQSTQSQPFVLIVAKYRGNSVVQIFINENYGIFHRVISSTTTINDWHIAVPAFKLVDNVTLSSYALGTQAKAKGGECISVGCYASAEGVYSAAFGRYATALINQLVGGHYNNTSTATENSLSGNSDTGTVFCLGNGTASSRSNAFRVRNDGLTIGAKAYQTGGADFAEYREWEDGNQNNEDRVGLFVTMKGKKIVIANEGDYIRGAISGNPCVIGNGDECWMGRYALDDFGRFIDEEIEEEIEIEENGEIVKKTITVKRHKENPDYDPTVEYIPREDRKEWATVGMKGLLTVRDDGSCEVDGFCKVANGGIATYAEWSEGSYQHPVYRVVNRVTENIVEIEI